MSLPTGIYPQKPKQLPPSIGFSRHALGFNGVNQYVSISDDVSLRITGDLTIIFWVKPVIRDAYQPVVSKDHTREFEVAVDTRAGKRTLAFRHGDGAYEAIDFPNFFTNGEVWYCCAIVRTSSPKEIKAYKNWVLFGTQSYTKNIVSGTNPVCIARRGTLYLEGVSDEVLVYNRALSQYEIYYSMLNYRAPVRNGLVLWLPFEEGTGLTTYDSSRYGNHGSLLPATNPPEWVRVKRWELRAEL